MKVACIQPQIFQNRSQCYLEIEEILKRLLKKQNKNEIICLPERWVPFSKNSWSLLLTTKNPAKP